MQFWAMSNKKMKIFLIIFSSLVLTFVGKSALAHSHHNFVKSKFSQSLPSKSQQLNAIEEEEISEDIHDEQDSVSSTLPNQPVVFAYYASETLVRIPLSNNFAIIKSHFIALFKQHGNYRI